jgi:MoaA/NifB/PqqE/SkfB family radical SAM enzyme
MSPVLTSLPVLIVNPYSRCNCRCVMCDIWKETAAHALTSACLDRQLSSVDRLHVKWIVLAGGEPLMHPDLFGLCEVIRKRGIRITLLSAGLLLDRFAAGIAAHVDDVIVSLDGPREVHDSIRRVRGAFERLDAGVRSIRAMQPHFPISARCTIQKLNFAHLRETADAARAIGLDSLSFLAVDVRSTAFHRPDDWTAERGAPLALTPEEVRVLEKEVEGLILAGNCGAGNCGAGNCNGFVRESAEKLRAIVRRLRCEAGECEPVAPVCNAPWASAVMEADGTIKPCFFHAPIGTLSGGSTLLEVLNSPAAVGFRSGLTVAENAICARCVCSLDYRAARSREAVR